MRIEAGQRFRDMRLNAFRRLSRTVWEVDRLLPGQRGLAHAVLVDVSDPIRRKTVSTAALADRSFFVPLRNGDETAPMPTLGRSMPGRSGPSSLLRD